ncbi:mitochondrial carrier protein, putative [Paecilomyces variotii No. 5]|uniref:Mitochondrial carrier protein, putative n=1 Tax=Byssochlamys spectabilis (strain No. 5 / NBRC 109023) TaxID=1356009 RepID=V5G8U9_BYSSN|nr:mitochondrial carrier protein, putative [Paecilomyces variotii No. 5]
MSFYTDPMSFEDELTDPNSDGTSRRQPRNNAATGVSAAGVRALSAQMIAFYFRAPIKAFFRTRVEVGAVLYTSYLQVLSALHRPTAEGTKRAYPPAHPVETFTAGFTAGTIQSVVAAPLDALQVRLRTSDMIEGPYKSMWHYGKHKLQEIGLRGVFAGWTLTFLRDSFGYAVFFSTFEYVKAQWYYSFITRFYGSLQPSSVQTMSSPATSDRGVPVIKPHYAIEPCFLMLAGLMASVAQQGVQHPLSVIQNLHFGRLEYLDQQARLDHSRQQMMRHYFHAYQETFARCQKRAARAGGWRRWLFRGFVGSSIRQVPSTSAGLVIFELVRRKYASPADVVHIQKDGYDILLN